MNNEVATGLHAETPIDEADLRRYVAHHYPDAAYTFTLYHAYYRREYAKSVAHGCWPKTNEKPALPSTQSGLQRTRIGRRCPHSNPSQ